LSLFSPTSLTGEGAKKLIFEAGKVQTLGTASTRSFILDVNKANTWTILQSIQTYAINFWGDGYFSINAKGNVSVKPSADKAAELDLFEIAQSLREKNLSLPVLVRFTDILK
jgi:arginine decarboxylase-like protein